MLYRWLALLRRHLYLLVAAGMALFFIFYYLAGVIVAEIRSSLLPAEAKLIATGLMEYVLLKLQIAALLTGVALVVLAAVLVALRAHYVPRASSLVWLSASGAMLLVGFVLTYRVLLPQTVKVLTLLTTRAGVMAYYTVGQFVMFVFVTALLFTLCFLLPVLIAWLALQGVVGVDTLKRRRRHFYLATVTVTAIITADPTPVSQLMLSAPLIILYELTILLVSLVMRLRG